MKNLHGFDAFKLTKGQMNAIAGGVTCVVILDDGSTINIPANKIASGMSAQDAYQALKKEYSYAWTINCK